MVHITSSSKFAPAGPRRGRRSLAAAALGIALASGLAANAGAQAPSSSPERPGLALDSLLGNWEGSGWSMTQEGGRESFDIFERVESVGNGHAMMIRGMGYTPAGQGRDGRLVHDAGALVGREGDGYRMIAATARGGPESYEMSLTETGFTWTIPMGPQGRIVFTAVVTEDSWTETGEYCPPQGEACFPTMSMTLSRVDD